MPQTVPNSPTNGAVDPTVARKARPSCVRLCTLSIARWIDMLIQSFMLTLPSSPSCFDVASRPDSAMKRYGLPSFNPTAPFCTEGAVQNVLSAARAWRPIFACSYTLVMMTYQLPIDMMTRMPSVIRATRSPPFHNASRPYGFSTISVVFSPTLGAAAGAAGATAGGGGVAVVASLGGAAGAAGGAEGC